MNQGRTPQRGHLPRGLTSLLARKAGAAPASLVIFLQKRTVKSGDKVREPVGVDYLEIVTLEGVMRASPGDYVIKGVNGEFYPCKPDVFKKTYEEIEM